MNNLAKKYPLDPSFVLGSIRVMNCDNLLDVLRIVGSFLETHNDEYIKRKVYNTFTASFAEISCVSFAQAAYSCMAAIKYKKDGEKLTNLVRRVYNNPIFVNILKKSKIRIGSRWMLYSVTKNVESFFDKETIINLLESNLPKECFLVLGCHSALLERLDLQKKWLTYYARSKTMPPFIGRLYLTDEAIKSVPVEYVISFAYKLMLSYIDWTEFMPLFSLETLKKILIVATVSHGLDYRIELSLHNIEHIEKKLQALKSCSFYSTS